MIGGKSQAATKPTAMGSLLQAATYGQTIPTIYGMTQSPLLAIWAANLRQGGSVKKFKQLKKGITAYVENIDFLLGHNPIMGVQQMWNNGSPYPLNFVSLQFVSEAPWTIPPDDNFYAVIAVTITEAYDVTFNDYGGTPAFPIPSSGGTTPAAVPPPVTVPAGQFVAWCYPTIVGVSSGPGEGPSATATLSTAAWASSYSGVFTSPAIVTWGGFQPPPLPEGAVVQAAYATVLATGDTDEIATLSGSVGLPGTPTFSGQYSTSVGEIVEGELILTGVEVWGELQTPEPEPPGGGIPPGGTVFGYPLTGGPTMKFNFIGIAVYYTLPSNPPGTYSGNFEIPMWNELEVGPDPTDSGSYRNYPYLYRWQPSYGRTVYCDTPILQTGKIVTIYYSQLTAATSYQPPITKLRLAFEPQLGSGSEYSDANLSDQQIVYPMFAGLGSSDIDLGSGGVIPSLQAEVQGKWGLYPTGDGDFADMIEDVFKSGLAQAAIGAGVPFSQVEHGLSAYAYPGLVQKKIQSGGEAIFNGPLTYNVENTEGNFLVVIATGTEPDLVISDSVGNAWTPVFATDLTYQVWYAKCATTGANTVSVSGQGDDWTTSLLEIGGVDTFDAVSLSASVTGSNQQGLPGYLLAIPFFGASFNQNQAIAQWDLETPLNLYGQSPISGGAGGYAIYDQRTIAPGSYAFTWPAWEPDAPTAICLLAFKCVNPPSYPDPVGDFLDTASLDQVRLQCRANGLWGSLSMNAQQAASDWLKTLYSAANAAPVFMGFKLYSMPYSEVSAVGNGAIYIAPTAGGPQYNLTTENGDFLTGSGSNDAPLSVKTAARVNQPNVLQMQCINRDSNYNPSVVAQPDAASISLFGVRKADPVVNNAIQDVSIARQLLGIMVRKLQYGGDVWSFNLPARWCLLAPMGAGLGGNSDAVLTVTDPLAGVFGLPVRLTSIEEQSDGSLECQAEPFVYGMYAPSPFAVTEPTPYQGDTTQSAGDVNPPIIFEPVPALYGGLSGDQLWVVISSGADNYGGCQVYISTNGGASYVPAGDPVIGSAVTGYTTADWPAAADPDTTNNLPVDLTECNGTLESYSTVDENNFLYPCYVQAASPGVESNGALDALGNPLGIESGGAAVASGVTFESGGTVVSEPITETFGYELMAYAVATLTAANQYTLMATGSGNALRRAVDGAPDGSGEGVEHLSGSRFALLSPAGAGILKLQMPAAYVGQTLYFKIISFNTFAAALQSLSDVPAYTYTPTGVPGSV